VSAQAPSSSEIDRFRDRADRFIADLDEEYYLHYSGLKETLDVEQVYERYEDLTRLETAQSMEGAPTELWRFACEGFLGNLTREHQSRVARVEAEPRRGRRADDPVPDAAGGDVERARQDSGALEETCPAARREPESGLPDAAQTIARRCSVLN
jgi:hypothetical protein